MADKKNKKTYKQKQNAICVTLYDASGEVLSPIAQQEAEDCLLQVAIEHKLLLNIATT